MALYEHVYLARQDISPQQVEALTDTFKAVIEERGGKVAKSEYWGLKSLAYRIKKSRKAHFTLLNIDAPPDAVSEMERQMGISDDIIRHITIRVDAHEEGPSAMVRSRGGRDRDERRGRRDDRRDGERDERREGDGRGARKRDDDTDDAPSERAGAPRGRARSEDDE
jgi:small subunit ribosomal protein S6